MELPTSLERVAFSEAVTKAEDPWHNSELELEVSAGNMVPATPTVTHYKISLVPRLPRLTAKGTFRREAW